MLMKVSDLDGRALNWAVAYVLWGKPRKSEHWHCFDTGNSDQPQAIVREKPRSIQEDEYNPSGNWAHGGPLIPICDVYLFPDTDGYIAKVHAVFEDHPDIEVTMHGSTPLQAACLCIVKYLSRCNDEIEIPDELCEVKS
ncbi:phage protein NinX family protein [Thalassospira aquimaris]|uniref:DUF2591 family protein n=1 Tax=Thalassospira aquimaris TaxID=3037796 RepID=A0ABT6GBF8_9PROT|nr:phage protein NinX family protein [Thalassospira sp. FZY0004]MDG4719386.1 DUF2591 family protein [Thalassospira sp. FZY0004]